MSEEVSRAVDVFLKSDKNIDCDEVFVKCSKGFSPLLFTFFVSTSTSFCVFGD
jgi:hypothetical protein